MYRPHTTNQYYFFGKLCFVNTSNFIVKSFATLGMI